MIASAITMPASASRLFTFLFVLTPACSIIDGLQKTPDGGLVTIADTGPTTVEPMNPDGGFEEPKIRFTDVDSLPAQWTNSATASFAYDYSPQDVEIICEARRNTNNPIVLPRPCPRPIQLAGLEEGQYEIIIRVRSPQEVTSSVNHSWNVDLTAPSVTDLQGPESVELPADLLTWNPSTNTATTTFEFQSDESSTSFECRLDDAAWAPCVSPHTQNIGTGPHTFFVRAIDRAGNIGSSARWEWYYGQYYTQLAASEFSTCGIKTSGSLWCWGQNQNGELGNDSFLNEHVPQQVIAESATSTTWLHVSAGEDHFCAIDGSNTAWCWGSNYYYQLGNQSGVKNSNDQPKPLQPVGGNHQWKMVKAGATSTCGLTQQNDLYCWGTILRTEPTMYQPSLVDAQGNQWRDFFVDYNHVCAITTSDKLYCWGAAYAGQLGNGQETDRTNIGSPLAYEWKDMATSNDSNCGITNGGQMYCWGLSFFSGQSEAFLSGLSLPYLFEPTRVGQDSDWQSIDVGFFSYCAKKVDGRTFCWGFNRYGQLGNDSIVQAYEPVEVTQTRSFSKFAMGKYHSCALHPDGPLYCWGSNQYGQLQAEEASIHEPTEVVPPISGLVWTTLDTTSGASCGVTTNPVDGNSTLLWCWGRNEPKPDQYSINISGSYLGDNSGMHQSEPTFVGHAGQIRNLNGISMSWYNMFASSESAGSNVYSWGWVGDEYYRYSGRTSTTTDYGPIEGDLNFLQLSSGRNHSCGVVGSRNDSIWCWGDNRFGQVGNSSASTTQILPIEIETNTSTKWRQVSTGTFHSCGINDYEELWCWGDNAAGQIDLSSSTNSFPIPTRIHENKNWDGVAAGGTETCATTSNGLLFCWSRNRQMTQINHPSGELWSTISKATSNLACAIDGLGELWCWGSDARGEIPNFDGRNSPDQYTEQPVRVNTERWQDVRVAYDHVCALREDQTLWCWGDNRYGQIGMGGESFRTTPWLRP